MKSFKNIHEKVAQMNEKRVIAVAAADDQDVLEALLAAREENLADFLLVGNETLIRTEAKKIGFDLDSTVIINEPDSFQAARKAVNCVRNGEADILMKGFISTANFLKAILEKEIGLRTNSILSHVALFEIPILQRFLIITDCAINISPGLKEKVQIINNSEIVARALEIRAPKVAPVCAVETVNLDMPATVDAALLAKMSDRGQIKNVIVDGPLALDNAISEAAAEHKGIKSQVAGKADIILVPGIETGNVMYKTLSCLSGSHNAGIIMGAAAPVILTSRSDSSLTKLNSIALSILVSQEIINKELKI